MHPKPPLEGRQDLSLPEPHRPALATEQPEPRKVSPLEPVEYGRGGEPEQHAELARRQQTSRSRRRHPCTLETPGGAPRQTQRRERTVPAMYLAGLPIPGRDVLELARLVNDARLAERLETAYGNGARILALEIQERESILSRTDHPQARSPSSAGHSSPNTSAGSATGSSSPAKPVNRVWGLPDRRYKSFGSEGISGRGKSRMGRDV